jgi:hypothetical protein
MSGRWSSARASATRCLSPLGGAIVAPTAYVKQIQRFVNRTLRVVEPVQLRIHEEILLHGQAIPQPRRLCEKTDVAVNTHAARCRANQVRQHTQRCRLAGAVGPEQREDFARRQLERQIVNGNAGIEPAREM